MSSAEKRPHCPNFNLLGASFDCKLVMSATVEDLAKSGKDLPLEAESDIEDESIQHWGRTDRHV